MDNEHFEVRDFRRKEMFRVDDEYLNGYSKLCGTNATLVYLCLCRHSDRNQESFPSVNGMAEKLGVGRMSVIRGISSLIDWNIISKVRERREDAKWLNNRYLLLDKSVWKPKPSTTNGLGSQVPNNAEPSTKNDESQVPQVDTKVAHEKGTHTNVSELEIRVVAASDEDEKPKKTSNAKYPNARTIFALFPKRLKGWDINTTELKYGELLFEEKGLDDVQEAIQYAAKHSKEPFFPSIDKPSELYNKWSKLEDYYDKKRK